MTAEWLSSLPPALGHALRTDMREEDVVVDFPRATLVLDQGEACLNPQPSMTGLFGLAANCLWKCNALWTVRLSHPLHGHLRGTQGHLGTAEMPTPGPRLWVSHQPGYVSAPAHQGARARMWLQGWSGPMQILSVMLWLAS